MEIEKPTTWATSDYWKGHQDGQRDALEDVLDHFTPYRPILDSNESKLVRDYVSSKLEPLKEEER